MWGRARGSPSRAMKIVALFRSGCFMECGPRYLGGRSERKGLQAVAPYRRHG